jgi:N-acetyl-gamma-glutamyl-phosphate reductase
MENHMKKIFIDGSKGTTGLQIFERLAQRNDIEIISLPEELRKSPDARKEALNQSDIAFLCLPDAESIESVKMVENSRTVIIDASTAHRTNDDWVYGFAELPNQEEKIRNATRIANPGCHASGFVALVAPLVRSGIISADTVLSSYSLTGYSGGGKKMIAEYEADVMPEFFEAPRIYGLAQNHKHLPEMKKVCGLNNEPVFSPIVAPYYKGMTTVVFLPSNAIHGNIDDIKNIYKLLYTDGLVHFAENNDENGFLSALAMAKTDGMKISVSGNEERILLLAVYDNLGKGASGAAIECMNLVIGAARTQGLVL